MTIHYVYEKRTKQTHGAVQYIAEHRFLLSKKRSDLLFWFGSKRCAKPLNILLYLTQARRRNKPRHPPQETENRYGKSNFLQKKTGPM
jgi:hypothetical protein